MGMDFVLKFATIDPIEAKWQHLEVSSEIFLNPAPPAPHARATPTIGLPPLTQVTAGHYAALFPEDIPEIRLETTPERAT